MASELETSLDRFLRNRGMAYLNGGVQGGRIASIVQIGLGSLFTVAAIGAGLAPLFGVPWEATFGMALGFGGAGLGNLIPGLLMRKRLKQQNLEVTLTPQAREFLARLVRRRCGWRSWGVHVVASDGAAQAIRNEVLEQHLTALTGLQQRRPEEPPLEAGDALERAAFQFNRILGLLSGANHPALVKMGSRVITAADNQMAEILHYAALAEQFPESAEAAADQLEGGIGSLTELADRLQGLASREPSLTERMAYRSGMDDVLDELRMEQLARSELRQHDEASENLRVQD